MRDTFNDPLTNDAVVVLSRTDWGVGIAVDLPVEFAEIPGCTGINGGKLVKRLYQGASPANTFAIKNMDGSKFTCPDGYDLNRHAFHELDGVPVSFAPASPDATVTGLAAAIYPQDRIKFTSTGALPPELTANTDYWITYRSGTTVRLSAAGGGTPISFSTAGSGTHTAVVTDERTSYAGTMVLQPYAQTMNHLSALSRNQGAVDLGGGHDGPASSIAWSMNNSVAASFDGAQTITHTIFLTAMPRVLMTENSIDMSVEYFDDRETLAVGAPVYFRESCKLPAGLEKGTPYYIVAADAALKTIRVSATPGGAAIAPTALCDTPYYWLYTPGCTSTKVSLGNDLLAVGDTVTLVTDNGATPIHPLVKGQTYYIDTITSGTVAGTVFRWATIKSAAGDSVPISFSQYPMYPDSYFEKVASTGAAPVPGFRISAFTTNGPSGNNWYWSSMADRAFCVLTVAHGGTDAHGSCVADQATLDKQQTGSQLGGANPGLDHRWNGRATASTPAEIRDRGYYAGTATVEAGSTGAALRWRAPDAGDSCTVETYSDAGRATPIGRQVSDGGLRWRSVIVGSLTPATRYWYKVQCGYDVETGTILTKGDSGGVGTLTVELPAESQSAAAMLETSADGISWASGPASNCLSGCSVASAALFSNQAVWYRWRRLNGTGATLKPSEALTAVVW